MLYILEYEKYNPRDEYKEDKRRNINLGQIKKSQEYMDIISLGFKDITSSQQEENNTLKFQRKKQPKIKGYVDTFYTIHPTGVIRRYNPTKGSDIPEGQGNPIKKYERPFRNSKEYLKGLRYLFAYLDRKQKRGDLR